MPIKQILKVKTTVDFIRGKSSDLWPDPHESTAVGGAAFTPLLLVAETVQIVVKGQLRI